ncbi:HicA-like toxin [Microbacterium phage Franklin22]|uniref:HicA-like toxin n=1 Tax=Microbacterium phage Franklin22 TaxID=2894293 RepID=UPI001E80309C|nr:HicA-like toxin [Microbacterium phage Franklin22]UGL61841.1 HicA-like toxin [Microbacterium phage Franklin22]
MNKHMKDLIKTVEKQGGEVSLTRNGHVQFKKDGRVVATGSGTPSDPRSWKNLLSYLRKAGFTV